MMRPCLALAPLVVLALAEGRADACQLQAMSPLEHLHDAAVVVHAEVVSTVSGGYLVELGDTIAGTIGVDKVTLGFSDCQTLEVGEHYVLALRDPIPDAFMRYPILRKSSRCPVVT